jgi:MFS family permease
VSTNEAIDASGFRRYLAVLRVPHLGRLYAAAFVGRLPIAMHSLASILLLSDATGSYAVAGAGTAAFSITGGATAPVIGRVIDRVGQTPVLVTCALGFAASTAALIVVADTYPHAVPLVACAAACGLAFPPLFSTVRVLITSLAGGPGLVETAFAFEAVVQELFFILGPLLVAVCVAIASPELALGVAAAMVVGGTLVFATTPASRRWRGSRKAGSRGALGSPGMRTLLVASVMDGMTFGTLEVALPAFAQRHGSAGTAGVLLAVLALASMLGGLWYGTRRWTVEPGRQILWFSGLLPVGLAPLVLAGSVPVMGVLLAVAGLSIAPAAAITFILIGRLVPEEAATEAYTWLSTAVTTGFATGGAVTGAIVESVSVPAALAATAAFACGGTLVIFARRKTLLAS